MRISFTSEEIDEWLEALQNHFCTDSEEAIQQFNMITKKLKNAEIRSKASRGKIRAVHDAERKKKLEERGEIQRNILREYREHV